MKSLVALSSLVIYLALILSSDVSCNPNVVLPNTIEPGAISSNQVSDIDDVSSIISQNSTSSLADDNVVDPIDGSASGISSSYKTKKDSPAKIEASTPSVTSVHQVWTASSSGSLDELSPEIIGKLRNDVPFLAAYALRPRLVGVSSVTSPSSVESQLSDKVSPSEAEIDPATSASGLEVSSSQLNARQSLSPRLSDFSELNVETSSTSKSEHHHKRKTTLKKKPTSDGSSKKNLILATASQFTVKHRKKASDGNPLSRRTKKPGDKTLKGSRKGKTLKKNRSGRLKKNKVNRKSSIESRRLQSIPISDVQDDSKTNGIDQGIKGGSPTKPGSKPFYSKRKEETETSTNDVDNSTEDTDEEELDLAEPRRVGDDDVEEGGDTVTVMPKFDGVDDDPEVPIEDNDDSSDGSSADQPETNERDSSSDDKPLEIPDTDPRTKRVNREKSDSGTGTASTDGAVGGGIGTTTTSLGSGVAAERGREDKTGDSGIGGKGIKSGVEFADDDENQDKTHTSSGSGADDGNRGKDLPSSVSKANDNDVDDEDDVKGSGVDNRNLPGSISGDRMDESDKREFDSKRVDSNEDRESDDDQGDRKGSSSSGASGEKDSEDRNTDDENSDGIGERRAKDKDVKHSTDDKDREALDDNEVGHPNRKMPSKKVNKDCDDGSYHHDHHHDHHDSIKWLQDSVPGEPGQDYPIFGKVNLTDFNCRDQRYPGYYADVMARCQVFHICQADGRQDSFLCPNGTIFSQTSRVCVWWNSFDCEDAPKYYALNAQLFKKSSVATPHSSTSDLRPLDGTRINPKDGSLNDDGPDGGNSIDGLIKSMRRQNERGSNDPMRHDSRSSIDEEEYPRLAEGASGSRGADANIERNGSGLTSDDEATVQRKSTRIEVDEDEPAVRNDSSPSRLRHSGPRRKRRANSRPAPPKLKSRRVSRNSRRRKLRHGVKPKRRA